VSAALIRVGEWLDFNRAPAQLPEHSESEQCLPRRAEGFVEPRSWSCPHIRLSLPRARTIQNGAIQFRRQCLDCGRAMGSAIGKAEALAANQPYTPSPFDEELYKDGCLIDDADAEQRAAERERKREVEAQEWWEQYERHLRSDAWHKRRRKVIERCNRICEGCRELPVAEVHHLTYDHLGAELLFELVGLCVECHEIAHGEVQLTPYEPWKLKKLTGASLKSTVRVR
jgi:hypothetical protein